MKLASQDHFDAFKRCYPELEEFQKLEFGSVFGQNGRSIVDWNYAVPSDFMPRVQIALTECEIAVGTVVFDGICLAIGAAGLRKSIKPQAIEDVAKAAQPALSKIEVILKTIADPKAKSRDVALGIFKILGVLKDAGCLKAVWSAFVGNLTWYNAALYGVTGIATIVAALATDGLALAAEIVLLLVSAAFMAEDIVKAVQVCKIKTEAPAATQAIAPAWPPFAGAIAIKTSTMNYVTMVDGGGYGGDQGSNPVAQTNRKASGPWERFTLQPLDHVTRTVAFQTANGLYLGAVDGGGLGGPASTVDPIHTDAKQIGDWEKFFVLHNDDGSYSVMSKHGFFITMMGGGGVAGTPATILQSTASKPGSWETFALVDA